jgi:hypothetical protein
MENNAAPARSNDNFYISQPLLGKAKRWIEIQLRKMFSSQAEKNFEGQKVLVP